MKESKGRMPGPFLDPINFQGPYANVLLEYVSQLLQFDKAYVARLERHYRITKQICSGQIQSSDAKPSPVLTELVPIESIIGRAELHRSESNAANSRSQRADREIKKRQRQARKRNRH